MKVLLVHPPTPTRSSCRFPLGLGYIAAVLHKAGHEVEVLDLAAMNSNEADTENLLRSKSYEICAITGLSGHYKYIKKITSLSKKSNPSAKIIIGGVGFSSMPQLFMEKTECDVGVIREGEETIIELLGSIKRKEPLSNIRGIWYREDGRIIASAPRGRIKDLDKLPFPQWDLFPIEKYLDQKIFEAKKNTRAISMVASRGCPFDCTFCFRDFGRETFRRSVENIISEIKELQSRYGVKYISFVDELFNSTDKYVNDFCDRLIDENISIKWDCRGRVDLVNEDLIRKMKRAGCVYMGYGVESANEIVLQNMRKRITIPTVKKAVDLSKKYGIKVSCCFMIGMLGETEKTFQETVDFIKKNDLHKNYGFFYTTPFPGTELFGKALEMGLIKDLEKYVESLGETHKPYINLTSMSDELLGSLKKKADDEIRLDYKIKHPFWFIEEAAAHYRIHGFFKTVNKIFKKIFKSK